jgi:hypothetical protein
MPLYFRRVWKLSCLLLLAEVAGFLLLLGLVSAPSRAAQDFDPTRARLYDPNEKSPTAKDNYAQCLIDELPGTSNAAVRLALIRKCLSLHPAGFTNVPRGLGLERWFSFTSPDECILKKARGTGDSPAAALIAISCHCLYRAPRFAGELCGR